MSVGTWCPRRCQTDITSMSLSSVMRPPEMTVGKAPMGPPDELRSLSASRSGVEFKASHGRETGGWEMGQRGVELHRCCSWARLDAQSIL